MLEKQKNVAVSSTKSRSTDKNNRDLLVKMLGAYTQEKKVYDQAYSIETVNFKEDDQLVRCIIRLFVKTSGNIANLTYSLKSKKLTFDRFSENILYDIESSNLFHFEKEINENELLEYLKK